ncbi:MAG: hypothetical protein J5699_08505 [Bacteroidales bacterium]|nr:hypothetical protein [Bacteroidales bacterium]
MKRVMFAALAVLVFLAAGCGGRKNTVADASDNTVKPGDLLFVAIPGDYVLDGISEAIAQSTGSGELNFIHTAILDVDSAGVWVLDATIKHGVNRHPLDTFLVDFTLKDGTYPELEVWRLNDDSLAKEYVGNASAHIGLPYDFTFLPDNGSYYCTELVYDSYVTPEGEHLFSTAPMNFALPDGTMPVYWEQLFAKLGRDIPQGEPGTNPQTMRDAPAIHKVDVNLLDYSYLSANKSETTNK